ncbi:hypothetical protein [Paraburkholderia humisilvae]
MVAESDGIPDAEVFIMKECERNSLQALYMGRQWKMLPVGKNAHGWPEIHPTRIYRMMRRWQADGSRERGFAGTVHLLRVG